MMKNVDPLSKVNDQTSKNRQWKCESTLLNEISPIPKPIFPGAFFSTQLVIVYWYHLGSTKLKRQGRRRMRIAVATHTGQKSLITIYGRTHSRNDIMVLTASPGFCVHTHTQVPPASRYLIPTWVKAIPMLRRHGIFPILDGFMNMQCHLTPEKSGHLGDIVNLICATYTWLKSIMFIYYTLTRKSIVMMRSFMFLIFFFKD